MKPWTLLAAILAFVTPVRAVPPNDAVISFNEIHYNPPGTGEAGEWLELFNQMGVNVDMSGWKLGGGVDFTFPDGTVIAGGDRMVIAKTPGGIPGSLGPFTGALSNSGDKLQLLDRNGRVMDEFTYGDKGEWPVAPDGGGVTLAKREPYSGSARAENWGPSAQAGGTPGGLNYPPPPAPITTRVVTPNATWKYENSGAAPAANWKTVNYDDSTWSSGQGGFQFGGGQVYMDPPPPTVGGGIWTMQPWTSDADSGISNTKTYTHKIGLQRAGGYTPINGVTFDSPGANVSSGANWALLGAPNLFNNNTSTLPAGSGSFQLCQEFFYGATQNCGISQLQITGLTPGQGYFLTLYTAGFGGPGIRLTQLTPSDSGIPFVLDENAPNTGNGMLVKYHYKAPANGILVVDFLPLAAANTWHHYAFSNEVAATTPASQIESTGVAIADFSSQLLGTFTRNAVNCVNNSGLTGGRHGTVPDGTMWLSNGTFAAPNDPLPAEITFDLGSLVHVTSFHVWNYNEATSGLMTHGAKEVNIQVAQNAAGPFTSAGLFNFIKASGLTTEPGQHIELDQPNVRYVRFTINTNHNGDAQFAGLSEVKFYKEGIVSSNPIPYREKIATLFNTGTAADGSQASVGSPDVHYTNVTGGVPAVVQAGHPAWLAADGVSQWTGLTANGQENVAFGSFTWRTTCDLSAYQPGSEDVKFYVSADNNFDNVSLNGVSKGLSGVGFTSYLGPYSLPGFSPGANTIDFIWSNAGPAVNPGGFRVKWDATAQPILARTTLPANPITTYFRQAFTNSGNPLSSYRLLLNYAADDGAVFYLNGSEIHRVGVTGSPINTTPADADQLYPRFSGSIEVPANALVTGANVLAVELHQAGAGNPDAFFTATLDLIETPPAPTFSLPVQFSEIAAAVGGTFFVEIRNTGASPLSLSGYTINGSGGQTYTFGAGASLAGGALLSLDQTTLGFRPLDGDKLFLTASTGAVADAQVVKNNPQARDNQGRWLRPNAATPGAPNTFSLSTNAVVVNEIMYHHHPTYLPTGSTPNDEEWVELYNRSGAPVVLTGWTLRGGISFDFAPGQTIAPGGYLVVASNPAALVPKFPTLAVGTNLVGPLNGSLTNNDDVIRIEDANGNPVNEVHYYHAGRWDERADGGGSSLELRHPDMNNTQPEAWAASDETSRSAWQTFSYTGSAATYTGSAEPTQYNELVLGLLSAGEFLIDDISVKETGNANDCIQNGTFASGDASTWRLLGTHGSHGRSVVVDDPSAAGEKVLKVVATGATEHMHNHCETTLKRSGSYVAINGASTYTVAFRARWLSGSPRLHSRLYFNRLARQSLLPIPDNNGTPGAQNSRFAANPGPTFSGLAQSPILPEANLPVVVRVTVDDPQTVAAVTLKWRKDAASLGSFNDVPMTLTNGVYEGSLPSQTAGSLVQFYIQATDGLGAVSTFPAGGANSRALVRWKDGIAPTTPGHGMRLLMLTPDADFLHAATNVMSNDTLPATLIYRENEVFYDMHVHLKSSERGRYADTRVGFTLEFDPTHLFRGTHENATIDRSCYGRGTTGNGYGMSDIVNWQFINRAGGVPAMYNDLVYFIAPRSQHTGSAQLVMAEFNDVWLDSQFEDGGDFPVYKYELIYYPTTTTGGVEGLKIPQPDGVVGVEFESLITTDKEAFRWDFLLGNARTDDDYGGMLALNQTFRAGNPNFNTNLVSTVDIDEWLRVAAVYALAGINDCYMSNTNPHNMKFYRRGDGRMLLLPWDMDFQTLGTNAALLPQPDLTRITNASPAYQRLFYQHLKDLISTSFNTTYLGGWINHYQSFNTSGGNWADINAYVDARVVFVNSQISAVYGASLPFDITGPNGGADFSAAGPNVTLTGQGWVDVRTIRVQSSGLTLEVTWTSSTTWQVTVPIAPGPNPITLVAYDYQGNLVGSDTIIVTGTGSVVPAAATNLVISELHYHPADPTPSEISAGYADPDDFEFVELLNIGTQSINLGGCQFVNGITYSLPATTLAPGAYLVIPRRTAAFNLRHPGVSTAPEYFAAGSNMFSNNGEPVALVASGGADIARFTYKDGDAWPASPDGNGPSLVLVAPKANPVATDAMHWRASAANDGNPGASDALALPADLSADDDHDGLSNLVDHAVGNGSLPVIGFQTVAGQNHLTLVVERNPLADVNWEIERATTFPTWAPATLDVVNRETLPSGIERLTLRVPTPRLPVQETLHAKLTAKP